MCRQNDSIYCFLWNVSEYLAFSLPIKLGRGRTKTSAPFLYYCVTLVQFIRPLFIDQLIISYEHKKRDDDPSVWSVLEHSPQIPFLCILKAFYTSITVISNSQCIQLFCVMASGPISGIKIRELPPLCYFPIWSDLTYSLLESNFSFLANFHLL